MFLKVLGRSCCGGGLKYASSPAQFKQRWGLHLKKGVLELLRHNPSSRTTSNHCLSACVRICASDNILFISLEMESCHLLLSFAHLLGDRKCDGLKVPKKQTNCKVVPQGQDGSVCTLYHTGVASILRISITKCSNPIFID